MSSGRRRLYLCREGMFYWSQIEALHKLLEYYWKIASWSQIRHCMNHLNVNETGPRKLLLPGHARNVQYCQWNNVFLILSWFCHALVNNTDFMDCSNETICCCCTPNWVKVTRVVTVVLSQSPVNSAISTPSQIRLTYKTYGMKAIAASNVTNVQMRWTYKSWIDAMNEWSFEVCFCDRWLHKTVYIT